MHAILILGAAVWPDGPSPALRRRTAHAAALWHARKLSLVVPCGGIGNHGGAEAHMMRDLLIDAGLPAAVIQVEDRSTSTLENIQFALPILRRAGVRDVVIVTDLTHAPRAAMVARHYRLRPSMSCPSLRRTHVPTQIRQALRETVALPLYAARLLILPRDRGDS